MLFFERTDIWVVLNVMWLFWGCCIILLLRAFCCRRRSKPISLHGLSYSVKCPFRGSSGWWVALGVEGEPLIPHGAHEKLGGSRGVRALLVPVRAVPAWQPLPISTFLNSCGLSLPLKHSRALFLSPFRLCSPSTSSHWVAYTPQSQADTAPHFSLLPATTGRWQMNSSENDGREGKELWPLDHSKWWNNCCSNLVLTKLQVL